MKFGIREFFTIRDIDIVAVIFSCSCISIASLFPMHEWALFGSLFVAGAGKASKLGELATRERYLIPWTKMSLIVIMLTSFVCAQVSDWSSDYWSNYVAALCFGIWGYMTGVTLGFAQYFWLNHRVVAELPRNLP